MNIFNSMKGKSFSPQYSRTKTREFISNFSDNPLLIKTLQLNRLSNKNIHKNSNYQIIKKSLKKFDKDSLKAQGEYNQLKLENNFYSSQLSSGKNLDNFYKSLSNSKEKQNKRNDIFDDIKEKYVKMGYKIPNLSVKHNLFKIEPLLEESESKIKEGLIIYPNSQRKNVDYLTKLINLVDKFLYKKDETINHENEQFLYTSTGFKSKRNLSQHSKPSLTISNETYQMEQKKSIECENIKILEQIKILIQLINNSESNNSISPQTNETDKIETIKKVTSSPKIKFNLQTLDNHQKLQKNSNSLSKSRPPSNMSTKSIFSCSGLKKVKRGSVLGRLNKKEGISKSKIPKISKELEAMIKFKTFKNNFEFLEFAYKKLLQNEYELVLEMLKIFLKQAHHYDDNEIKKKIYCKRNINPVTLLNDFSTLSLKIKSKNIHTKIQSIYEKSSNFLSVLPNLKKIDIVNKKLCQMDKQFIKNITNSE